MADSPVEDILSWENLIYLADLFETSGEKKISLLGGEPTLHPYFIDYIIYLLERDFRVTVFTSGIMPEKVLTAAGVALSAIPADRLSFLCNLNDPAKSPANEVRRTCRFLEVFGHMTMPGFNIYSIDFNLDFLFDYINKYGLHKTLRLGLTHPIVGKKNEFIKIEDFGKIIDRLCSYSEKFETLRVRPGLDCGFPICKFNDAQLGIFYKINNGHLEFSCGPVVDIGPDMNVWPCFPLSSFHKRSIYEFDSLQDIYKFYEDIHSAARTEVAGIYEECDECKFRETKTCAGGCLAHIIKNFKDEAPVRLAEMYP